jgi:hypothetical protein
MALLSFASLSLPDITSVNFLFPTLISFSVFMSIFLLENNNGFHYNIFMHAYDMLWSYVSPSSVLLLPSKIVPLHALFLKEPKNHLSSLYSKTHPSPYLFSPLGFECRALHLLGKQSTA